MAEIANGFVFNIVQQIFKQGKRLALVFLFGIFLGVGAQADALSALSNLGYAPGEAAAVVAKLSGEMGGADSASLIRAALKKMAPKT